MSRSPRTRASIDLPNDMRLNNDTQEIIKQLLQQGAQLTPLGDGRYEVSDPQHSAQGSHHNPDVKDPWRVPALPRIYEWEHDMVEIPIGVLAALLHMLGGELIIRRADFEASEEARASRDIEIFRCSDPWMIKVKYEERRGN